MGRPSTGEIEESASAWLIRRDSGTWSIDDQVQFEAWLSGSTLHRVAYLRLEAAWEDSARLKALGAGLPDELPPPRGRWNLSPFFGNGASAESRSAHESATSEESDPTASGRALGSTEVGQPKQVRRRWLSLGIAASALLAIGAASYFLEPARGQRYSTPVGGMASVPLIDGSNITLNTDSQIQVRLTEKERDVQVDQGEAFFQVAKDPSRPFVVKVGSKRVIAVGTAFSVRKMDDDGAEVVVTDGTVRVDDAGETILTPGSVARAGDAGVLVQHKTVSQAEERLSWRSGILLFRDETLADAVKEFNRYNERKIEIADRKVADIKIEGNFHATNVDAFLRLLESGFPVRAQVEGDRVILTSN